MVFFYCSFQFRVITVLVLCSLTNALVILNITGGHYNKNTYKLSRVIKAYRETGPKMCVKDCMLHKGCTAINVQTKNLTCELLAWTPSDQTVNDRDFMFSKLSDWHMDKNQCWPNPCKDLEKCIPAMHGHHVCVPFDMENRCRNHQCENGGTCHYTADGPKCFCPVGYSGERCRVCDCTTSNHCINGGTCTRNGEGVCSCYFRWRLIVDATNQRRGRIEVQNKNVWGTICDDGFGRNEAAVACAMFGFSRSGSYYKAGGGSGNIWLDDVKCHGSETSLADCKHAEWGHNDCDHGEDVGVECS